MWSGDFKELEDVLQKAGKDDELVQAELHEKCQQQAGHQHMMQVEIGVIAAPLLRPDADGPVPATCQALIFGIICDRVRR